MKQLPKLHLPRETPASQHNPVRSSKVRSKRKLADGAVSLNLSHFRLCARLCSPQSFRWSSKESSQLQEEKFKWIDAGWRLETWWRSSRQIHQNKWMQFKNNLRIGCIQKQHQSSALLYTPEKSVVMTFGHQSKTLLHVTPKTFILNPASLQHEKDRK